MVNKIILFLKTLTEKQILLLMLGITFGLRLYAVLMAKGIAYDSAVYGFMARDFLKGDFIKGLAPALHPFYPFLISLVSFDSTHVEIAGRLISLFFGTLTLIPVFYLAKEIAGQKAAIFSGLFYSFHPYLATYSGMLLSEATYWGLLTLSVYFFWTGLKGERIGRSILSGIFLTFAYLTRPEGIGYLSVYVIWVYVYRDLNRRWFKKSLFIGGFILPFLFLGIPYLIHIHRETGQWLISKKALDFQSHVLAIQFWGLAKNIIQNVPSALYHYLRAYHFTLWLFLLFGLVRVRQKSIKDELFFASFVLFHLFSLSSFIPSTIRFSVPLIPISLFWAGLGVLEMQKFFEKIKITKSEKWVSYLIILFILIQLPQTLKPERRHREEQKKVGLWLQQNTPKNAIIMGNSPQEVFYADREFVAIPPRLSTPESPGMGYKEIIHFAREKGVKYILINDNIREIHPDFMESIREADLKELLRYRPKNGKMTIIYEVIR